MLSTGGYKLEFLSEKVESPAPCRVQRTLPHGWLSWREIQALGDRKIHDKSRKVFSLEMAEALKTVNRAALFEIAEEVNSLKEGKKSVNASADFAGRELAALSH